MRYQEKINVLLEAIKRTVSFPDITLQEIERALIDGCLRIAQAEQMEKKITAVLNPEFCKECGAELYPGKICDCQRPNFAVEYMEEYGYGMWSYGGFECSRNCGSFRMAITPGGAASKEVARLKEKNGRHALNIIYPGCYILQAVCRHAPAIDVEIYRVMSINSKSLRAVCEVVRMENMQQKELDKLRRAIDVAMENCIEPNNTKNHLYWCDLEVGG